MEEKGYHGDGSLHASRGRQLFVQPISSIKPLIVLLKARLCMRNGLETDPLFAFQNFWILCMGPCS